MTIEEQQPRVKLEKQPEVQREEQPGEQQDEETPKVRFVEEPFIENGKDAVSEEEIDFGEGVSGSKADASSELAPLVVPEYDKIQRPSGDVRVPHRCYQPSASEATKIEKRLPEDIFSMIMIAPWRSWPFWYGMIISFFQYATYVLVLVDITNAEDSSNPFGFPANVDIAVRIAQLIALIILVPLQDEVLEGMIIINDGYQKEALEEKFTGVSRGKFILSVSIRLIVGALSILTSFILIMIESEVLEIFFNFIALQFINDLDNLGFTLVSEGILGTIIRGTADEISDTSYFTDGTFRRKFPLFLVFLTIMGGWTWILILQQNGAFVPDSIQVQFGDDLVPALATFSGMYVRDPKPSKSGRFNYVDCLSKRAYFGYCTRDEVWTFSYDGSEPCNYLLRSAKTETYDISETELWEIGIRSSFVPLEPFYMECFECKNNKNRCENGGIFLDTERRCSCPEGLFGFRCEFAMPCPRIELDTSDPEYRGSKDLPKNYDWLHDEDGFPVTLYEHPVYVDRILNGVILFNGRRWVIANAQFIGVSSLDELPAYLANGLQLHDNPVKVLFIAEPSDIGTLSSMPSPTNKAWYLADGSSPVQRPELDKKARATFDCAVCDSLRYPCSFGNPCINGTCNCLDGSSGAKCQSSPTTNGFCNAAFNTWAFSFDGGDCCQASCMSTPESSCGYSKKVEFGFPNCMDNAFSCPPGNPCWRFRATEHKLIRIPGAVSAEQPMLHMSSNGRVVVLGYRTLARVQVWDQVDALWVQRGVDIVGSMDKPLIGIAISTVPGSILDHITSPVGVRIAIGDQGVPLASMFGGDITYTIQVWDWDFDRFVMVGPPITFIFGAGNMPHFDFFDQGRYLALQVSSDSIRIFDTLFDNTEISTIFCPDLNISCRMGSFLSVSEAGEFLLQTTSLELIHVVGSPVPIDGDLVNVTWTKNSVGANAQSAMLSRDGRVITFNENVSVGTFKAFTLQIDNSSWAPLGDDILIEKGWSFINGTGTSALSVDGKTLSLGLIQEDGQTIVQVFRYDKESRWYRLGSPIITASPLSISPSYDSSIIAVADRLGQLRSLEISPFCRNGESFYRIYLLLDQQQNIQWTLRHKSNNTDVIEFTSPLIYRPVEEYRKVMHDLCLPKAGCSVFDYSAAPNIEGRVPTLAIMIDYEEVLYTLPSNGTHFFGHC